METRHRDCKRHRVGLAVYYEDEIDNPDTGCSLTVHSAGQAATQNIVLDGADPDTEITSRSPTR